MTDVSLAFSGPQLDRLILPSSQSTRVPSHLDHRVVKTVKEEPWARKFVFQGFDLLVEY